MIKVTEVQGFGATDGSIHRTHYNAVKHTVKAMLSELDYVSPTGDLVGRTRKDFGAYDRDTIFSKPSSVWVMAHKDEIFKLLQALDDAEKAKG